MTSYFKISSTFFRQAEDMLCRFRGRLYDVLFFSHLEFLGIFSHNTMEYTSCFHAQHTLILYYQILSFVSQMPTRGIISAVFMAQFSKLYKASSCKKKILWSVVFIQSESPFVQLDIARGAPSVHCCLHPLSVLCYCSACCTFRLQTQQLSFPGKTNTLQH